MGCGDQRLEPVSGGEPFGGGIVGLLPDGLGKETQPLGDLVVMPLLAVLVGEQYRSAVVANATRPAGVLEHHQRPQGLDGRLPVDELVEDPPEADGFVAEIDPHQGGPLSRDVALGEHQVDDGKNDLEALGESLWRRHGEGNPGGDDLALRPGDPCCHRRLADEEQPGDLADLEPGDKTQRQRRARTLTAPPGGST